MRVVKDKYARATYSTVAFNFSLITLIDTTV